MKVPIWRLMAVRYQGVATDLRDKGWRVNQNAPATLMPELGGSGYSLASTPQAHHPCRPWKGGNAETDWA